MEESREGGTHTVVKGKQIELRGIATVKVKGEHSESARVTYYQRCSRSCHETVLTCANKISPQLPHNENMRAIFGVAACRVLHLPVQMLTATFVNQCYVRDDCSVFMYVDHPCVPMLFPRQLEVVQVCFVYKEV